MVHTHLRRVCLAAFIVRRPAFISSDRATNRRDALLAAVARTARDRRVANRQSAARVERNEEHQVEGRDSRPRQLLADRLGRSRLRADGRSGRRAGRRAARAARRPPAARRAPVRRARHRSQDRPHDLGTRRRRAGAARSGPLRQRHLGVEFARSPTAQTCSPTSSRSASTPTT